MLRKTIFFYSNKLPVKKLFEKPEKEKYRRNQNRFEAGKEMKMRKGGCG